MNNRKICVQHVLGSRVQIPWQDGSKAVNIAFANLFLVYVSKSFLARIIVRSDLAGFCQVLLAIPFSSDSEALQGRQDVCQLPVGEEEEVLARSFPCDGKSHVRRQEGQNCDCSAQGAQRRPEHLQFYFVQDRARGHWHADVSSSRVETNLRSLGDTDRVANIVA